MCIFPEEGNKLHGFKEKSKQVREGMDLIEEFHEELLMQVLRCLNSSLSLIWIQVIRTTWSFDCRLWQVMLCHSHAFKTAS